MDRLQILESLAKQWEGKLGAFSCSDSFL